MTDQTPQPVPAGEPEESRTAEEIRADIAQTREQVGDTVEALAAKTDVKARTQDKVKDAKQSAAQLKDDVVTKARQAAPASAGAGAEQVSATVAARPLPFATGGAFAAGVLIGWLLGRG
jgi:ElaB/YqjD/DUF883 family membrane-anchored ribosome-binding protein